MKIVISKLYSDGSHSNFGFKSSSSQKALQKFFKISFYCATIAYHVELNAISGGPRHSANVQEK